MERLNAEKPKMPKKPGVAEGAEKEPWKAEKVE